MKIRFDDELPTAPSGPVVAIEDLRAADKAVRFAQAQLRDAVADVQALDGLGGWVSWLTGNHETDVQRALSVVKRRQQQLAAAEATRAQLQATHGGLQDKARARAEAEAAEAIELELVADRIRRESGPIGKRLVSLEGRIERARAQAKGLDQVFGLGTAIRGRLKRALVNLDNASTGQMMDLGGSGVGGMLKHYELSNVRKELDGVDEQLQRFEAACQEAGLDMRTGDALERVQGAHRAAWFDTVADGFLGDLLTGRRIDGARSALETLAGDLTLAIDGTVHARRGAQDDLAEMEAQRVELLRSHR